MSRYYAYDYRYAATCIVATIALNLFVSLARSQPQQSHVWHSSTERFIFMSFIGSMQLKSCNYTLFEAQLIYKMEEKKP